MTMQAPDQWAGRRERWIAQLDELIGQIETWCAEQGWPTHRTEKRIRESVLGEYAAPALRLRAPGGDVLVTPVGLHIIGAEGRVDLEAWPTLARVKLIRRADSWQVVTDSNVPLREPWDRDTFLYLVEHMQS